MTMHKGPLRAGDAEARMATALTAAALEGAKRLGLSPTDTASILGVSQGALTAMRGGKRVVDGVNGEAERADALIRIVKRLNTLLGDAETKWRSWIRRDNDRLDATPLAVMLRRDGAQQVAQLLEQLQNLQA